MDNRKTFFVQYFDSIYALSNKLTSGDYDNVAGSFDIDYGIFMPTNMNAEIIDIGCGTGHFLYYLKKKGYNNFIGIDLSLDHIEFCKSNITLNVELADAFDFLHDKINQYDVISANDVIEHIPKGETLSFLGLIYQSLKPNGILLLKLPNMSNPFALESRYRDFTHESGFTEKSIYQVLFVAGFRNISIHEPGIYPKSIKSNLIKALISIFHFFMKKLFWYQGFAAPRMLSSRLVVIAKK